MYTYICMYHRTYYITYAMLYASAPGGSQQRPVFQEGSSRVEIAQILCGVAGANIRFSDIP